MSPQEHDAMSNTGYVVEGGGGRTYVTTPPDPEAYKAGDGLFVEFDVPSDSLRPASKPEWAVIPGPHVTTGIYGKPPSSMPPATNIEVTASR